MECSLERVFRIPREQRRKWPMKWHSSSPSIRRRLVQLQVTDDLAVSSAQKTTRKERSQVRADAGVCRVHGICGLFENNKECMSVTRSVSLLSQLPSAPPVPLSTLFLSSTPHFAAFLSFLCHSSSALDQWKPEKNTDGRACPSELLIRCCWAEAESL